MYNRFVLEQFNAPYHQGRPERVSVVGQDGVSGEGPYMMLYLCMTPEQSDRIDEAWFETYGCPAAIACGSWLAKWLQGRTVSEAGKIEPQDLMVVLGGLPLGKEHCAHMTIKALRRGLSQVQTT